MPALMVLSLVVSVVVLAFFIVNLRAGEKQIRYELPHCFGVEDPQFLRCMGQLLGPGILQGNRVLAFQNGEQIFPAMLAAIRGAASCGSTLFARAGSRIVTAPSVRNSGVLMKSPFPQGQQFVP